MKITIITATYNNANFIEATIKSVLAQTYKNIEIILVDDGSPDNCGKICDEYAQKDNRIQVIHKENGGLSSARNAGIDWVLSNSDSQWLTFIDSDDWIHPKYLELLLSGATSTNTDICVCTDLDEVFIPGWRKELEKQWTKNATRARYNYNWSLDKNNKPIVNFNIEKIKGLILC